MAQLEVTGNPRTGLIEEAIAAIQRDPTSAFRARFFGIKNYASFGDQREDHDYGMGPKHGSIVFRIGLTNKVRQSGQPLASADAIYYLECYRDFGSIEWRVDDTATAAGHIVKMNLGHAIREFDRLTARRNVLSDALANAQIESHVAAS